MIQVSSRLSFLLGTCLCVVLVRLFSALHDLNLTNDYARPYSFEPINAAARTGLSSKETTNTTKFHRIENVRVVVATKVLWAQQLGQLQQMVCLFHAAYNRHVNYDIVVFTTLPWTEQQVKALQDVVPTVNVRVVLDSQLALEQQLEEMTPEEREFLEARCRKKPNETLSWFHHCWEPGTNLVTNLGYSWQSEFRAYHLYTVKVLKPYRYMIWMDSDAYCTKEWTHDPISLMVERNLVLVIDNFPQGLMDNPLLLDKMHAYYNRTICNVELTSEGQFQTHPCHSSNDTIGFGIPTVHGFHHVTDLDFYRSNLPFLKSLVSSHRFSRDWDDQLAVTLPPAMVAHTRVWDYRANGIHLGIHHNGRLDGKEPNVKWGMHKAWKTHRHQWPVGREMCDKYVRYKD